MKAVLVLTFLFFVVPGLSAAEGLRFFGDLQLSRGVTKFVRDNGELQVRRSLDSFLGKDAIHIANLEGAVGDAARCMKGHTPCFPLGKEMLGLLAGFDLIGLENNHSLDVGMQGMKVSIRELKKLKLTPLGGRQWSATVTTKNGNAGIVAITDVVNAVADRSRLAMADSPEVLREIRRLRELSTVVAVYVHWGRELDNLPTERMKALAREYVRAGADLVVGTHPHVVGKVDCIQGKPIVYSLGNFLFDQKYEDTKKGAVLDCDINGDSRLVCRLSGHRTPFNWYLPQQVAGQPYQAENAALAACAPEVQKTWTGKFTKDGREKRLVLKKERADETLSYMELYDRITGIQEKKTPPMPILKLQPVDLDSDGVQEVALVQNIYSSLDREIAKRVYVYSFSGGFHALWRGSALSRPLEDALFFNGTDGRPRLLALHTPDSFLVRDPGKPGKILMSYRWNGFGFTGGAQRKINLPADGISLAHNKIRLLRKGLVIGEADAAEMK
jgi:hypothetical protein